MPRTAKTDPLSVRMARGEVMSVAVHDHRDGQECDLPDRPPVLRNGRSWHETNCYWDFDCDGRNICGCRMCTNHDNRRTERRRDRHQAKVAAKVGQW